MYGAIRLRWVEGVTCNDRGRVRMDGAGVGDTGNRMNTGIKWGDCTEFCAGGW